MTRTIIARVAGVTLLFYIAVSIANTMLMSRAISGEGTVAKLASIALHAADLRVGILLALLECFSALVLGVTLYSITRDAGAELAMLALVCRVCEGALGAIGIPQTLGALWLATAGAEPGTLDAATTKAMGAYLLMPGPAAPIGAIFWAAGSTLFSYLLLRGRIVPATIAWLGVLSSALLVAGLPLQLAGFLKGSPTVYMWLPALVFELALGPWLIIKGVAKSAPALSRS